MSKYSVSDAEDNLSELIDRALNGERVIITRDGAPVIEFKPIESVTFVGKTVTTADLEWLAAHRIEPLYPVDSGALLSQMRDEDNDC